MLCGPSTHERRQKGMSDLSDALEETNETLKAMNEDICIAITNLNKCVRGISDHLYLLEVTLKDRGMSI